MKGRAPFPQERARNTADQNHTASLEVDSASVLLFTASRKEEECGKRA